MTLLLTFVIRLVALFLVATAILAFLVGQSGVLGLTLTGVILWIGARMLARRRTRRRFGIA